MSQLTSLNEMAKKCGLDPPGEHRYKALTKNLQDFRGRYSDEMLKSEYPIRRTGRSTTVVLSFLCTQEKRKYDTVLFMGHWPSSAKYIRDLTRELGRKAGIYVPQTCLTTVTDAPAPKLDRLLKQVEFVVTDHAE